jgi:DUF3099 family protein
VAGVNIGRSRSAPEQGPKRRPEAPVVHSITGAAQAHSDDLDARIRRYLISMAIRTGCVILVLVIDSPVRWVFAGLAIVLPYVAVVMANAAGGRRGPAVPAVPIVRVPLAGGAVDGNPPSNSDIRSDASSERTN